MAGFFDLARFVVHWRAVPVPQVAVGSEGLEYAADDERLHYRSAAGRLHYAADAERLHFRTEED